MTRHMGDLRLGTLPFSDVFVRGDPTTLIDCLIVHGDDATVGQMGGHVLAVLAGQLAAKVRDVPIDISKKGSGRFLMFQKLANGASGLGEFGRQSVHPNVSVVANDQFLFAVKHAEPLRHIVQGGVNPQIGLLKLVGFFRK